MPPATFSAGNSSRMIPKDRGKTAPATPWITRATMSSQRDPASPPSAVPAASTASITTSIFSLPNMSPMRPRMGVATDELTRKALRSQATASWLV